jgi:hypothetical protein
MLAATPRVASRRVAGPEGLHSPDLRPNEPEIRRALKSGAGDADLFRAPRRDLAALIEGLRRSPS